MFIHYSNNNKIYTDNDFDAVSRTGIEIKEKRGQKTEYIANTLVEFKSYKTLRGAQKFMEKSGRKPIAIEDGRNTIFLNSQAEKMSKIGDKTKLTNCKK